MNKIVRENYPVEKLPEDLRRLVPGAAHVTISVILEPDETEDIPPPLSPTEAVDLMRQMQRENAQRGTGITTEEAVRRIREIRDEWDD